MHIRVTFDQTAFLAGMGNLQKQIRFASAVALTRAVKAAQTELPAALERALDQPTDYTKRGSYIKPARRDQLEAEIGFKDRQARYMAYQIAGGVYNPRRGGIKLPGDITLNAFGNIPRGTIARLKAAAQGGKLSAALAKRLNANGNRRKGAAPIQLFYGRPRGKGWENAPMGIWRRIPPATPGAPGKLVPVIVFEDTPARYRARFDFRSFVLGVARRTLQPEFTRALQQALATAR